MKLTEKEYEQALDDYINDGINWEASANSVIKADAGDVEQFAADSFWYGAYFVMKKFGIEFISSHTDTEIQDTVEPGEE